MKDIVSTRVLALVSLLPVTWVACSIYFFVVPYGFPGLLIGWASLALCSALWAGTGSAPPIAQIIRDVEAEPLHEAVVMPGPLAVPKWTHVAWMSLWPVLLFAGTPDPSANLSACKSGGPSCERPRLTLLEMTELARSDRARNVSNCRNGLNSCDPRKLTKAETIAVAVAKYDRNVSNCMSGHASCKPERLTRSEARDTAAAEHRRRCSECWDVSAPCDQPQLIPRKALEEMPAASAGELGRAGDDHLLHRAAAEAIRRNPYLGVFDQVLVDVEGGHVRLWGSVEQRQRRERAAASVARLPGVLEVRNDIDVQSSKAEDVTLRRRLFERLYYGGGIDAGQQPGWPVRILVSDGRVTLPGAVASGAQRERLVAILYDVSGCRTGDEGCAYSMSEEWEAAAAGAEAPSRNMADCLKGLDSCDYSLLSRSETQAMISFERARNYTACRIHRGYCDRSRLTPAEAASIPTEAQ